MWEMGQRIIAAHRGYLVVISKTIYDELKSAGFAGKEFGWDQNAVLTFGESITATDKAAIQAVFDTHDPLAGLKANAIAVLNERAEQARLKFVTPGSAKAMEYTQKAQEAIVILADSSPVATNYPFAAKNAASTGRTLKQVATEWDAKAKGWASVGAEIADLAETASNAINALTVSATLEVDAQAIIDAIVWP